MVGINSKIVGIILILIALINVALFTLSLERFYRLKKKIKQTFFLVFPVHWVTSFFGVGFFPTWQGHWTSFIISIISFILYISFSGLHTPDILSIIFYGSMSICMVIISLVSITLLIWKDGSDIEVMDNIMIHVASGQIFCIFLSFPSIRYIYLYVSYFYSKICTTFIVCAFWVEVSISCITSFILFFTFYRFIDEFNPWPSSFIERSINGPIGYTLFPLINAFYTALLLNIFFIIFGEMQLIDLINVYKYAFLHIYQSFFVNLLGMIYYH